MTAPSYTEDLNDIDLAANDTNWEECTATGWTQGGSSTYDVDYPYIQGAGAVTQQLTKTGVGGLMVDYAAGFGTTESIPTDGAILVWQFFASSTGVDTFANGGMRVLAGSSRSDFEAWKVGGGDFGRYPFGGWVNHAFNPDDGPAADYTEGSPTSYRYVGAAVKSLVAVGKGNPHGVDAIRYGRCSSIFRYGDSSNGYCTFAGFAAVNDNINNMWGLIQAVPGGDSDVQILIDNTPAVSAGFNSIEVTDASSRVDMDNVVFKSLGTQSPGKWVCNHNADLNITSCQFISMGVFTLGGTASEFLNCQWVNCSGTITVAGGKLNGSKIVAPTIAADASAVDWDVNVDPDGYLDNLTISEGTNAHHAIEFGSTSPSSITIRGLDVGSDFAATNGQNNSTFHITDSNTGNNYTINCVGCSGNMTYKSAGAGVTIVSDPVTVKVTTTNASGTLISDARVLLRASDGTGPFPYQDVVTIVNSGTTATVTHASHGMATNDKVEIRGASLPANNGVFSITYISTSSYSYTMGSTPGSSPTGTITSTFVALEGLTVAGVLSTSRVYSTDQPVTGWARKSSSSPYYKTGPLSGVVDSADGYNNTAVLILDE